VDLTVGRGLLENWLICGSAGAKTRDGKTPSCERQEWTDRQTEREEREGDKDRKRMQPYSDAADKGLELTANLIYKKTKDCEGFVGFHSRHYEEYRLLWVL
jgi:hypothetical protein